MTDLPKIDTTVEMTGKKSADALLSSIVFFSDLHFDFSCSKYKPSMANEIESDFIAFLSNKHKNNVILLAGDYYNDFKKTLGFIERLEQSQIVGFFVLGNHDYWNKGKYSYQEVQEYFREHTKFNTFFRFLSAGISYQIGNICFIGDTGWTSFDRGNGTIKLNREIINLPEELEIKNFSFRQILEMHNKWIDYANSIIETEPKVMILTHFPMVNFAKKNADLWWSSQTSLRISQNYWNIYGHTHKDANFHNYISRQRGYKSACEVTYNMEISNDFYFQSKIGTLLRVPSSTDLIDPGSFILNKYYNFDLIPAKNVVEIVKIKKRGFIRCAANTGVFVAISSGPDAFIAEVERTLKGYIDNLFINYTPHKGLDQQVIASIRHSITILKKNDLSNIREYMTAAVILGYVWNRMPSFISSMRPLDDYDVTRFYLMFLTLKKYGIQLDEIKTVRKNPSFSILVGNADIYIPKVNDKSIEPEELQIEFAKVNLIEGGADISRNKNIAISKISEREQPQESHRRENPPSNNCENEDDSSMSENEYRVKCNTCAKIHALRVNLNFVGTDEREMGSETFYSGSTDIMCICGNLIGINVYGSEYPEGAGLEIQDVIVSGGVQVEQVEDFF